MMGVRLRIGSSRSMSAVLYLLGSCGIIKSMDTKTCPKCKKVLAITEFHKDRSRPDGVYSYCKKCNYRNARKYIETKPEYYKEYQEQYRQSHLEELQKYGREYSKKRYQTHKEIYRQYVIEYRARKRGNKAPCAADIKQRVEQCYNSCVYCGGPYEHLDHVVPVSTGGVDAIHNLVPSCSRCNLSKNNTDWGLWYGKQSFYDEKRERWIVELTKPF